MGIPNKPDWKEEPLYSCFQKVMGETLNLGKYSVSFSEPTGDIGGGQITFVRLLDSKSVSTNYSFDRCSAIDNCIIRIDIKDDCICLDLDKLLSSDIHIDRIGTRLFSL